MTYKIIEKISRKTKIKKKKRYDSPPKKKKKYLVQQRI